MKCKICKKKELETINIQNLPRAAQNFKKKITSNGAVSSILTYCKACGHIQLNCNPPEYYKEVIRSSGISKEMISYRKQQFMNIKKEHQPWVGYLLF